MTDQEMKVIAIAANQVWNEIGADILGMEDIQRSIPRDEVIEVVIDADRLNQQLRWFVRKNEISESAVQAWKALPYEEMIELLTEHAFKFERYGW